MLFKPLLFEFRLFEQTGELNRTYAASRLEAGPDDGIVAAVHGIAMLGLGSPAELYGFLCKRRITGFLVGGGGGGGGGGFSRGCIGLCDESHGGGGIRVIGCLVCGRRLAGVSRPGLGRVARLLRRGARGAHRNCGHQHDRKYFRIHNKLSLSYLLMPILDAPSTLPQLAPPKQPFFGGIACLLQPHNIILGRKHQGFPHHRKLLRCAVEPRQSALNFRAVRGARLV